MGEKKQVLFVFGIPSHFCAAASAYSKSFKRCLFFGVSILSLPLCNLEMLNMSMHEPVYGSEGLGAAVPASAGDGVDGGRDGDAADGSFAADETACRNLSTASLAPGERGCMDGSSSSDDVAPSLSSSSFSTRPAFRNRDASSPMLRCLFHSSDSSPKPPRRPIETICVAGQHFGMSSGAER